MTFFDDPVASAAALPALHLILPLFVFVSAALEYIFPPYWGDLFVLVGFFLSGQETIPALPWMVFLAALLGSVLGSFVAFVLGRRYGLTIFRRVDAWRPMGSRQRIRELLGRFGERLLLVNRFLPIIRGLLLYGAGALRLRLGFSIAYSTVSNLAWLGMLMAIGLWTAGSWEQILERYRHYNQMLGGAALVLVIGWIAILVLRNHWRRRSASEASS